MTKIKQNVIIIYQKNGKPENYMRLNDDYLRLGIICLCVVIIYIFIFIPLRFNVQGSILFQNLITKTAYSFFYYNYKEPDIILIALDDESLDFKGLKWPWPRNRFVELINKINNLNPSVIAFDIAFIGKSSYGEDDDIAFADAIKNAGNVVMAYYIDKDGRDILPLKMISDSAKAIGFINKIKDDYNMIRYARAVTLRDGKFEYCFEVNSAAAYKNIPFDKLSVFNRHLIIGDKKIPLDLDGTFPIKYTYKSKNLNIIPVKDILSDNYPGSFFKNKIVFFGLTAISLHDIHFTPFGSMPGVVISANTLANVLNGNCLKPLPVIFLFILCLLLSFLASYAGYKYRGLLSFLIVTMLAFTAYLFSVFMFKINIIIDIFGVALILYMSWSAAKLYTYGKSYFSKVKLLNSLTTDTTGLYNLYYLLVRIQQHIDSVKKNEDNPVIAVFKLKDNLVQGITASNELKNRAILYSASLIRDALSGYNSIIARISDLELGVMISKISKDKLKGLLDSIYARLNNREIIYPEKNIKYIVNISIGACHGKDIAKKSARLFLSVAQKIADEALNSGHSTRIFDDQQDRVSLLAEDTQDLADESNIMNFILEDVKRKNMFLNEEINTLKLKIKKLTDSHFDIILSLVKALEEKDIYTAGHSERVAGYSVALAKGFNLNADMIEIIKRAALLHDIGKISIPDHILHKNEGLTSEDRNVIQRHEMESVRILEPVAFLKDTVPLILHHHEHFNGSGYPHGLSGERIPLGARIIAIADSYDAMTSGRGYNKPLTTQEAIAVLKEESGRQFDPELVSIFIQIVSD